MEVRSYPKVYNLGHPVLRHLFRGPVLVQEKVDGSQFSFGVRDGNLFMRSKRAEIYPGATDKLFAPAVATVERLFAEGLLLDGGTYRGEAVCCPRHNTLKYDRAPDAGLVLFDFDVAHENRVDPDTLQRVGDELGLEVVPAFYYGEVTDLATLEALLNTESFLGGVKLEGIVIKNYAEFNERDGKMLMGKWVRPEFAEQNSNNWKAANPNKQDVVFSIVHRFATEARWAKAVQHLREEGKLEGEPKDIGLLMREVPDDVFDEHGEEIRDMLYGHFKKQIARGLTRGLPEWYKARLIEEQTFE